MVGFKNCKTIDINQQLFILVSLYFVHIRRLDIFSGKKENNLSLDESGISLCVDTF